MTMSTHAQTLPAALADVRRAYRLVQAYQRRLCDLFQLIDEELVEKHQFQFWLWDPFHASRPTQRKTRFFRPKTWAWDLSPGYQVQCQWTATVKKRTRRVAILAIADTGFGDTGTPEPDPGKFAPVEECGTELLIGLWTAETSQPDWDTAWERMQQVKDYFDGKSHQVTVDGKAYVYESRNVSVVDLVDEAAVRAKLLGPIDDWLSGKV